ncbi:Potential queD like [Citrifermentans bremense]|nr:DUF2726 domain-containing protein [Citrifermentans bremense]BCO11320.1 Potential queD like [Citrifermentans bremense]
MNLVVVLAIVVILVGLLAALKIKSPTKDGSLAFQSREPFLSPAERSFLGVLEQALDNNYRVLGKVRLGDLIKPAKGLSKSKRVSALNKVNQKHVDFVVCSSTDLAVLGVVELDDQSHGREDRAERDLFVDEALSGAGIPIARFSAKKGYQIQEVRTKLADMFKITLIGSASTLPQAQEPTPPQAVLKSEPGSTPTVAQPEHMEMIPMCERCGATMVKRQAKNGEHAGKFFWACSTFPKCRQVVAIT